jgi:hypothetical protein
MEGEKLTNSSPLARLFSSFRKRIGLDHLDSQKREEIYNLCSENPNLTPNMLKNMDSDELDQLKEDILFLQPKDPPRT